MSSSGSSSKNIINNSSKCAYCYGSNLYLITCEYGCKSFLCIVCCEEYHYPETYASTHCVEKGHNPHCVLALIGGLTVQSRN